MWKMFDFVFPSLLFLTSVVSTMLCSKMGAKLKLVFANKKLQVKEVLLLVFFFGVSLVVFAYAPELAVVTIYFFAFSFLLFFTVYSAVARWDIAIILPTAFVISYLFLWNVFLLDLFAITAAILVSVYLTEFLDDKGVIAFAVSLTVLDIIAVLGPHPYMVVTAERVMALSLPGLIIAPTFPAQGVGALGVGDVLLSNLLTVKTFQKYRFKGSYLCSLVVAISFATFGALQRYLGVRFLPATPPVVYGWLLATLLLKIWTARS